MRLLLCGGALLFTSCVFQLDDPPLPDGVFVDRVNFAQILENSSSTTARFSFSSYSELFRDTLPFFVDFEGQVYDRGAFLARLNQIDAADVLQGSWLPLSVNDGPVLESSAPTELVLRNFTLVHGDADSTVIYVGDVRLWVWFNGARWQIVQWKESGGVRSVFHPEYTD